MTKCVVCKLNTSKNRSINCVECCGVYHFKCGKIKEDVLQLISKNQVAWLCDKCKQFNQSTIELDDIEDSVNEPISINNGDAKKLHVEFRHFKETQNDLQRSVEHFSSMLDSFHIKIDKFGDQMKLIDKLIKENATLRENVSSLETRIEDLERRARDNNVEISGIPEVKGENLLEIVGKIGDFVNFPVNVDNIFAVHRVQVYNRVGGASTYWSVEVISIKKSKKILF